MYYELIVYFFFFPFGKYCLLIKFSKVEFIFYKYFWAQSQYYHLFRINQKFEYINWPSLFVTHGIFYLRILSF